MMRRQGAGLVAGALVDVDGRVSAFKDSAAAAAAAARRAPRAFTRSAAAHDELRLVRPRVIALVCLPPARRTPAFKRHAKIPALLMHTRGGPPLQVMEGRGPTDRVQHLILVWHLSLTAQLSACAARMAQEPSVSRSLAAAKAMASACSGLPW